METAQQAVKTAQQAVKTLTALWLEGLKAGRSDEANALKQEVKEAETKLEKAEQKYKDAKASVQAGPEQAGASACAVVAVAFGLQLSRMVVVCLVRATVFAFWGHALLSARILLVVSFTVLAYSTAGSSLFCARFALSRLRLFLFEARLSGYCVGEGKSRESTLGS